MNLFDGFGGSRQSRKTSSPINDKGNLTKQRIWLSDFSNEKGKRKNSDKTQIGSSEKKTEYFL
jgi:hypothetical protein